MEKKLSELNKELKLVKVGTKEFKSLQKEIKKTEKALDKANGKSSIFAKGLKLMSGLAIGAGIANVAKSVVTLGANLEQAQISFEVMLGSAEKANYLLKELTDFAAKTPFELVGLRQDAKLLLAMGVQMEELIPTMTILGNAASGLSVDFNRLALAYGQVQAKGKLQGGELKQFTEAGVPLIKVL
jgi:phage tail tape-measure protein